MPNRIFVDTSFVLALINERDQYHDQAEHLSHKFENSSLITTDAVLLEIGNALAKDFREEEDMFVKAREVLSKDQLEELGAQMDQEKKLQKSQAATAN